MSRTYCQGSLRDVWISSWRWIPLMLVSAVGAPADNVQVSATAALTQQHSLGIQTLFIPFVNSRIGVGRLNRADFNHWFKSRFKSQLPVVENSLSWLKKNTGKCHLHFCGAPILQVLHQISFEFRIVCLDELKMFEGRVDECSQPVQYFAALVDLTDMPACVLKW